MNPKIAMIGFISLVILFGKPFITNRWVKMVPSQLIVILVAVALGRWMHLSEESTYTMWGNSYKLGPKLLVDVPMSLVSAITTPDFSALKMGVAWKWVFMFSLIGSLESLLSAKAVDMLDPLKRKTNLNRDLLAIGIANTAAASVGGLPMISEIVRSKANIDNGARSRVAGVVHGLCLLAFVALLPGLIHQIPLAALAAMLVYTGFRLASPYEFAHVNHIGREQLLIFVTTIVAVLATDLLIGIAIGISVKFIVHLFNGAPLVSMFSSSVDVEQSPDGVCTLHVHRSAVFSNWIPLRKKIIQYGYEKKNRLIVDLSRTKLVDHTVMEKLHALQRDFSREGLSLEIRGLHDHAPVSSHAMATQRKKKPEST